ncbi:DUF6338 family protein [Clostridium estertheticum]|uniref:DUF6338 family protein n=1 Tax=Clostridium estertheticum TaxID=238834 RepID=UPI001C0D21DF|nr:DUF6338 family protein [Clostridium estertheticum]MBU3174576.1 hypothetical protein [Clostridium estertheticum]
MQQYISILLFIVPGFLMRMIHEKLVTKENIKSDFEKTIMSLIYGIPILMLSYMVVYFHCGVKTVTNLISKFDSLSFTFNYAGLLVGLTLIVSIIWSILSPRLTTKLINLLRWVNHYPRIGLKPTAWDEFTSSKSKKGNKAIAIYQNDKLIARGFLKNWNLNPEDDKELTLEDEDIMIAHPECFEDVEITYYNLSKNIFMKEYNLDKLYSKLELIDKPTSSVEEKQVL